MILNSQASLQLGAIPFLIGQQSRSDVATDWWIEALAEGATLGNPQPVTETIQTLLADGSLVVTRSHDNREASFQLRVNAPDGALLAEAEAALFLECSRLNELTWTPPDGYGATTVFRVVTSSLEHEFDDFNELRLMRAYTIRLICEPFGRSLNEVVETAAVATGGADTQINACDSTTGWSSAGGTLSVDTTYKAEGSGALKLVPGSGALVPINGGTAYRVTMSGTLTLSGLSVNLSTTPFVAVKVWTRYSESVTVTCKVDGLEAPLQAAQASGAANGPWTTFYFYSTDAAVSSLAFTVTQTATFPADPALPYTFIAPSSPDWSIRIDDVRRSGAAPTAPNSGRERTLLIPVSGSARTQGSLSVQHETAGLGQVLIYTNPFLSPIGYTPDLGRHTVSYATQSSSPSYLSGNSWTLDVTTPWRIDVPAAMVPRGGYELMAYGSVPTGKTFTIDVSVIIGSVTVASQQIVTPASVSSGDRFRSLGWVMLPPVDLPPGSTATIRFDVKYPLSATSTTTIQELLILKCDDDSALTITDCGGTGAPALGSANNRMWVKAATLTQPIPAVTVGTKVDETDSYNAGASVKPMGRHNFVPPYVLAFIANTGGANPAVSYRHPPRHHTHAT